MGHVTKEDIRNYEWGMLQKKKKYQTTLIVCAAVFITDVCVLAVFNAKVLLDTYPYTMFGLLAVVSGVFSVFGFLLVLSAFDSAVIFLNALKTCSPNKRITSFFYRHYDVNKKKQYIFEQITERKHTVDEAKGIQRIAEAERLSHIKYAVALVVLAASLTIIAFTTPESIMAIKTKTDSSDFKAMLLYGPRITAALFVFLALRLLWMTRCNVEYINAVNNSYTDDYIKGNEERIDRIISELRERTSVPSIRLTANRKCGDVFSSKFGGTPYLPPGFAYPKNEDGPFCLLAQLNFEQLPKLPDFPQTGILQIFIADNDQLGRSHGLLTSQSDFRVVYHDKIIRDESMLEAPPITGYDYDTFPLEEELVLHGELEQSFISTDDFRFGREALSLYNKIYSANETRFLNLPNDIGYVVSELSNSNGHHIGGYPVFTQRDPREDDVQYENHTVLLMQIDSDRKSGILFGNSGEANFFITPEQLKARDFSNVLYTWDCF